MSLLVLRPGPSLAALKQGVEYGRIHARDESARTQSTGEPGRSELLLLLLKKIGNARLGEGDCHPISPKTPAPHYQPIEEKKRKGK